MSCNLCQLGVESVVQYAIILLKITRCDSTASGSTESKTSILWGTTQSWFLLEFVHLVLGSLDAYPYSTHIATRSITKWSLQKHCNVSGREVKISRIGNTAEVPFRKPGRKSGFYFCFQTTGKWSEDTSWICSLPYSLPSLPPLFSHG